MAKKQQSEAFVIHEGFQTFPSGDAVVSIAADPGKSQEFKNFETLTRDLPQVSKSERDEQRQGPLPRRGR